MKLSIWQRPFKQEWFSNVTPDLLSGLVVALALIPESIAFSAIVGVDPKVGLYASFCMAIMAALTGGRPGMISAATGAMALVLVSLVKEHGINYMFAATILTGLIQIFFGWRKLGRYMKYVPRAVMIGFVNALAIFIFIAQFPQFDGATWHMYAMIVASLIIIYGFPYITKAVPSSLVAIIAMTIVAVVFNLNLKTVGDIGTLPKALPAFALPQVPLNFETLKIIFPYSVTLAIVGLLESLLTAALLDDLTDTWSDKNQEAKGQGMANIVTGLFGGMAGCALIGQSVINYKSGGRTRLSTLFSGLFLLFLIIVMSDWVSRIHMAALVGVMFMVAATTFNWASIKNVQTTPRSELVVTAATVITVLITHNLAQGVLVGVILSAVFFVRKVAKLASVTSTQNEDGTQRTYHVYGQLFFVSTDEFIEAFDFKENVQRVEIDLSHAHLWDGPAVAAVDTVVLKFRERGVDVELLGMNEASATLVNRLGTHQRADAVVSTSGH